MSTVWPVVTVWFVGYYVLCFVQLIDSKSVPNCVIGMLLTGFYVLHLFVQQFLCNWFFYKQLYLLSESWSSNCLYKALSLVLEMLNLYLCTFLFTTEQGKECLKRWWIYLCNCIVKNVNVGGLKKPSTYEELSAYKTYSTFNWVAAFFLSSFVKKTHWCMWRLYCCSYLFHIIKLRNKYTNKEWDKIFETQASCSLSQICDMVNLWRNFQLWISCELTKL